MCFKVPLLNVHTNFVKVSEWRDIKNTFIQNKNVSTVFLELKMFHILAVNNKHTYTHTPLCVCVCAWERKRAQSGSRHKWNRSNDCCSSLCLHWQLQFDHTYYLVQSVFFHCVPVVFSSVTYDTWATGSSIACRLVGHYTCLKNHTNRFNC